jgi:hypothetical protein
MSKRKTMVCMGERYGVQGCHVKDANSGRGLASLDILTVGWGRLLEVL